MHKEHKTKIIVDISEDEIINHRTIDITVLNLSTMDHHRVRLEHKNFEGMNQYLGGKIGEILDKSCF